MLILFPDLNSPRIFVEIQSGERPPEEMEKQFVENIEALAIRQSDVIQVTSVSKVGSAQITVEYAWNKDMDEAFLDLQKALNTLTQNSEIDELKITQHDPNTSPVMIIGLTHDEITDMNELRKVAKIIFAMNWFGWKVLPKWNFQGRKKVKLLLKPILTGWKRKI